MLLEEPITATRRYSGPPANPWVEDDDPNSTMGIKANIIQGLSALMEMMAQRRRQAGESTKTVPDTTAADMFVDSLARLTDERELQRARVDIFRQADRLFKSGDFATFNGMLARINVEAFPLELLLTVARVASSAADELPARPRFYTRVRDRFSREVGANRTAKLLDALR